MTSANFISQRDALDSLDRDNVTFIDGSWYLPTQNRNAKMEFNQERIPGAIYFDIDVVADPDSPLPHMLPHPDVFEEVASFMGLNNHDTLVIYDGPGLFSAPRVWWTLKTMGAADVRILQGGFDKWRAKGLPVEKGKPEPKKPGVFKATFSKKKVASISAIENGLHSNDTVILDARPSSRFKGEAPEPREGLRVGHIPGSKSLPATQLVSDGMLVELSELRNKYQALGIEQNTPVVTTCGSGVTAAILALGLSEIGHENHSLYDGSWAQWGLPNGPEVETG